MGGKRTLWAFAFRLRRVRHLLVMTTLVAEEGCREQSTSEKRREEHAQSDSNDGVSVERAEQIEIGQRTNDHQHGDNRDDHHDALELRHRLLAVGSHVEGNTVPLNQFRPLFLVSALGRKRTLGESLNLQENR
jgi:hypothetical protein